MSFFIFIFINNTLFRGLVNINYYHINDLNLSITQKIIFLFLIGIKEIISNDLFIIIVGSLICFFIITYNFKIKSK